MKKIIFTIVSLALCLPLGAQTAKQWSLEECINHAIDHNLTIKQMELQRENAKLNLHSAQMSRLPDLNAGVGQNWNFGRTQLESGMYQNQEQSNTSFSVSTSIPLFTGFRISNQIAQNKLALNAAVENLEKAKEDLSLNVAGLFLQALFAKELVKVNENQLALTKAQVERTAQLVESGKVPASQFYDIEAQVAKDEVSVVEARNNRATALLDLAQSLELEDVAGFDIQEPQIKDVIAEHISSVQPPQIIYHQAVQIKPGIKAQEWQVAGAEKALKVAQAAHYPTLSLSAGYGTNYFYMYGKDAGGNKYTNRPFGNQFRNNAGEYIGMNLSIPIFNRFQTRNAVRAARLNITNQQLVLDQAKKTLFKEIQTAYQNAIASQEKYRAANKSIAAAGEAYKYAEERYQVGKSTVFELNEAKTKYTQSQSEQIQAKFDYIFRAKILDFYNGIKIKL